MKHHVDYRHAIDAPLELVWTLVADFKSVLRWVPGGDQGTVVIHGDGIGMTRDLDLPQVGKVQHRLDALDATRHSLTYSLTRGRPLGMSAYSVNVSLAGDEEHCIAHWRGEFEAEPGRDPEQMQSDLVDAYREMSSRLATLLKGWQDHA